MGKKMHLLATRVIITMIVLSMLPAGQPAGATFQECYMGCFILCAIQPNHTLSSCAFECLKTCLIPPNATSFHFCNLGCASSHCTNISTLHNPGGKKVEGCVNSCSGVCKSGYIAP